MRIGNSILFISLSLGSAILTSCTENEQEIYEYFDLELDLMIDGNEDLGNIFTPINLQIDNEGKLFLLDLVSMKILVFNSEGEFLYDFGRTGAGPGEFTMPFLNFCIDNAGNVYVIDDNNQIKVFHNDGSYWRTINVDLGDLFDIAAINSETIYLNGYAWGPELCNSSSLPAAYLLDRDGDIIREIGLVDSDYPEDIEFYGERKAQFSCILTTDEDQFLYLTSVTDYQVQKYDSTGTLVWSEEGFSPHALDFTGANGEGATIVPVVWDIDVEDGLVYVLWAQGETEEGYRVDVFDAESGEFLGFFHTHTPSEQMNMFIEVDDNYLYTVAYDEGIVFRYRIVP